MGMRRKTVYVPEYTEKARKQVSKCAFDSFLPQVRLASKSGPVVQQ